MQGFPDVEHMLRALQPREPVYCVYPEVYRESTRRFVAGFPGRVLYAVKLRIDPDLLARHAAIMKTGVPGVAYVRLGADVAWPEKLQVRLPP